MRDDSTLFFVGIDLGDVEDKVATLDRAPGMEVVENTIVANLEVRNFRKQY